MRHSSTFRKDPAVKESDLDRRTARLTAYLVRYGWQLDDASQVSLAYYTQGVEAAVNIICWMDDLLYGYSTEMRTCLERWEKVDECQFVA